MVETWKTFILWFGIILAVTIGSVIWVQNSLLFYPNTSIYNWSPDDKEAEMARSIDAFRINELAVHPSNREVTIPGGSGGISGYYIENFPGKDYVVHCHGTSGNIADRKYVYEITQHHELNLLLFDYEGYGKSKGTPSVKGILRNGISAVDYLIKHKHIDPKRILVWGESLGGPVAAWVGRQRPVKGIVLMATFSSMESLVRNMNTMGWARLPLSMIARTTLTPLDTSRWLSQMRKPVVIMHSKTDDYIPYICAEENFSSAVEPKLFIDIGGTHVSPEVSSEHIDEAIQFIEQNK